MRKAREAATRVRLAGFGLPKLTTMPLDSSAPHQKTRVIQRCEWRVIASEGWVKTHD